MADFQTSKPFSCANCQCGDRCQCSEVGQCNGCCICVCAGCDGSSCKCEKESCFCTKGCCTVKCTVTGCNGRLVYIVYLLVVMCTPMTATGNCTCGLSCTCGDKCKGSTTTTTIGCCLCTCQGSCDGSSCKCEKGKCFCDKDCCVKKCAGKLSALENFCCTFYLFFQQLTVYVTHPVLVLTSVVLLMMDVALVPVKDHVMGLLVSVRKTSVSAKKTAVQ